MEMTLRHIAIFVLHFVALLPEQILERNAHFCSCPILASPGVVVLEEWENILADILETQLEVMARRMMTLTAAGAHPTPYNVVLLPGGQV